MRQLAALVFILSSSVSSQVLIDANRAAAILQQFNLQTGPSLQCEITPIAPALTFSFRLQAGYLARLPLSQFRGPGHWISALIRVTPREWVDKRTFYLLRTFELPDVPSTSFSAELAGAFLVGQGHYQTNTVLFDDAHRACRADWQIEVKAAPRRVPMPAEDVMPISDTATGAWTPTFDSKLESLTVFLHAAPLNPRLSKMQASDVVMAISSLMTLLEELPARSVRLIVFNLHQDKELYRTESFSANDIDPITQILDSLQLGMVDYHALQTQNPDRELLGKLIHRELNETTRSGKVIFLGPDASYGGKRSAMTIEFPSAGQRFFYLQYRTNAPWGEERQSSSRSGGTEPRPQLPCQAGSLYGCNNGGNSATSPSAPAMDVLLGNQVTAQGTTVDPDAIATVMRKIKAKTFVVRNAGDFASAVDKIARF